MFRRFAFLLAIITVLLLAVIAINLTTVSTARAQSYQQWEYLYMIVNVDNDNGGYTFAAFPSSDKETLDAGLAPFSSKIVSLTLGDQTIKLPDNSSITQALNYLGQLGWEMTGIQPGTAQFATNFYFKRPIQ